MRHHSIGRRAIWFGFCGAAAVALTASSAHAQATSVTGTIVDIAQNPDVPGRGLCIQTSPPIPNTWACLLPTNPLYRETTALLYAAFFASPKPQCYIYLAPTTSGSPGFPFYEIRNTDCH